MSSQILLENLDFSKLKIHKLQDGQRKTDKFAPLSYDGAPLAIVLCKLPNSVRTPFGAGVPKDKDGNEYKGAQASMQLELTQEQFTKWQEFESMIVDHFAKTREACFGHTKHGKRDLSYNDYEELFKTALREGDDSKSYAPTIRVAVETKGNAAKIQLTKIIGTGMIKPKPGTVDDIGKGASIVPSIYVKRGVYINDCGFGVKLALGSCYVDLNNKTEAVEADEKPPDPDTSGMTMLDDDDAAESPPEKKQKRQ